MNASHDELRLSLGAYALGTLEPDDQRRVEAHLVSCPSCLAELDELLPAAAALATLSADDFSEPAPSDDLFARIAGAVAQPAPAAPEPHRFRSRRWLLTAAAVVVLLAGGGTAFGLIESSRSSHSGPTTVSAGTGPFHLAVAATDAPSGGTRLVLAVRGLPQHERCHLVATAADGSTHGAGTWDASYEGTAKVVESTDVPRSQLRRLTLYGNGHRKLIAVNL